MEDNNNLSSSSGNVGDTQARIVQNEEMHTSHGLSIGITNKANNVISFSHNVSVKLDENNYLLWKQQIITAVYGYGLESHLTQDQVPPMFKNIQDETASILNSDFTDWRRQDHLLMSWLLASMSKGMLTRMVGCECSFEIWEKVRIHFASQTKAKVKKLKTQLRTVKKGSTKMFDYLLIVKRIIDSLAVVGNPISVNDYIEALFDGLPNEYEVVITTVMSKSESYTIDEIEDFLLSQESILEKKVQVQILDSSKSALGDITTNLVQNKNGVEELTVATTRISEAEVRDPLVIEEHKEEADIFKIIKDNNSIRII